MVRSIYQYFFKKIRIAFTQHNGSTGTGTPQLEPSHTRNGQVTHTNQNQKPNKFRREYKKNKSCKVRNVEQHNNSIEICNGKAWAVS
jgi:hypothetical protein